MATDLPLLPEPLCNLPIYCRDAIEAYVRPIARERDALRTAISAHNTALLAECAAREDAGHPCAKYRAIHMRKVCPDCPRNGVLELPAGLAEKP